MSWVVWWAVLPAVFYTFLAPCALIQTSKLEPFDILQLFNLLKSADNPRLHWWNRAAHEPSHQCRGIVLCPGSFLGSSFQRWWFVAHCRLPSVLFVGILKERLEGPTHCSSKKTKTTRTESELRYIFFPLGTHMGHIYFGWLKLLGCPEDVAGLSMAHRHKLLHRSGALGRSQGPNSSWGNRYEKYGFIWDVCGKILEILIKLPKICTHNI